MAAVTQRNKAEQPQQDDNSVRSRKPTGIDIVSSVGIPSAIALLTLVQIVIAYFQGQQEYRIASEDLQHETMHSYLEDMNDLIFNKQLLKSSDPEIKSFANAITLNTARQLSSERKGQLLKFLYEAKLVGGCDLEKNAKSDASSCVSPIISLKGVRLNDLTAEPPPMTLVGIDLDEVTLTGAQLPAITLIDAEMNSAKLDRTNLENSALTNAKMHRANLERANLQSASLEKAVLTNAFLKDANLQNVKLQAADLRCADLRGANLTNAGLAGAKFKNARYSSDTQFPDGFELETQGLAKFSRNGSTPLSCPLE
jgi:uncharacterized protein YjbI with pentapeptide repeats